MSFQQPPRLPLAQLPTPLRPLDRLSRALDGPRIWLKEDDLTGCALSGNKVRKLEFLVADAMEAGADTLITCGGLQSNHCRAVAVVGARLGLGVHLVLRGHESEPPDGNLLLDRLAGARVSVYPHTEYCERLDDIFDELLEAYRADGHQAYPIPTGGSDATGVWGYVAGAAELRDDCERLGFEPAHIVCATGSGGTQAGLTAGTALCGVDAAVWGVAVCDDEAYFQDKVRTDLRGWKARYGQSLDVEALEIRVLDAYVGPGYARTTPPMRELIARVAREEGVLLDPVYTGKAFYGLVSEIEAGRFRRGEDLIFVHTGGLFGLFPQRASFAPLLS